MGIVALVVVIAMAVGLVVAGIFGVRLRTLVLLALGVVVALWGVMSLNAPDHDTEWSKADYAYIYALLAIPVFLLWTIVAAIGSLMNRRENKTARS